jgi:hypothetical protein
MTFPARPLAAACTLLAGVAAAASCGQTESTGFGDVDAAAPPGDDGPAPQPDTGATPDAGADDDVVLFQGDGGGGPAGCVTCSADLHQVLDCTTHQVVQTCPPTAGCDATTGQCVSPCASAASNKSSVGCEYYSVNPHVNGSGGCFAAFIANTWNAPVTIAADYAGQKLDVARSAYLPQGSGTSITYAPLSGGALQPDQVAILFLAAQGSGGTFGGAYPCPPGVTPAYTAADPAIDGTGTGNAFHITTSAPVVAYDIYPYGDAESAVTSATLLLPTSVWDTNYVAVTSYPGNTTADFPVGIELVALEDHTTITLNPAAAIVDGGTIPAAAKGAVQTYHLDHGQVVQLEQLDDLSGSAVQADKPIGAWGSAWCMDVPMDAFACDGAHQQIPPVRALGSEYVAVRYRNRGTTEESVPWRIAGAVSGTTLTYEPAAPAGAPAALQQGQVVEFESPGPLVVRSQDDKHPFYLAAHMTGYTEVTTAAGAQDLDPGDPETVNVVPPQQFLDHYVLFTDPTYRDTNIVVVRDRSAGKDVTLDCMPAPLSGWQPAGTGYEYTRVDVQKDGAPVGGCDNGRHVISSAAPFGVTVWGWDSAVSYAYPAGASVRPINAVVVPVTPPQ